MTELEDIVATLEGNTATLDAAAQMLSDTLGMAGGKAFDECLLTRAVVLRADIEDRVRSYAEARLLKRSEAIHVLIETGLKALSGDED